jgi:two-component system, NtrC family, sensor kinase
MADKILIVDDDLGVAALCNRVLMGAGYAVEVANRPHDALRLLREKDYDLLLLDIRLPEIDGFELLRLARERDPDLAIVIITGHGTIDTVVEALQHGAEGLVLKPFESHAELVQAVRQALMKSRQGREAARSRALRPLFEVSQMLLSEMDLERLSNLIVASVQGQFGTSCVGLYVAGSDSPRLELVASQGFPTEFLASAEIGPDAGLPGRSVAWSLPLWVTAEMPGSPAILRDLQQAGIASALCAPLLRGGKPKGAIMVGRAAEMGTFREGDLELLTILAGQAAVALENAGLYADQREYIQRIEESQQQLIQAEKLAALGRLVGSIAHEVNNPLQAIQNCLHLSWHHGLPEPKRKEYHDLAVGEVQRLIETVRQMLDFYRPTAADYVPTDLNTLLDETLSLAEKPLRDKQVTVRKQYRKTLPLVPIVRNNIKQVFLNMLLNARDAMENGGQLTLRTSLVDDNGRKVAQVAVTDTGTGIPPEHLPKVFEPFYTTKPTGTGIGLSVSYGIVQAHGGWIKVNSTQGSTTFTVSLPVERNEI